MKEMVLPKLSELPLVFTGDNVILPGLRQTVSVMSDVMSQKKKGIVEKMLEDKSLINSYFGLLPNKPSGKADEIVGKIGTFVKVTQVSKVNSGHNGDPYFMLNIDAICRFCVESVVNTTPHLTCKYTTIGYVKVPAITDVAVAGDKKVPKGDDVIPADAVAATTGDDADWGKLCSGVVKLLSFGSTKPYPDLPAFVKSIPRGLLPDVTATVIPVTKENKLKMLNTLDEKERIAFALELLERELMKKDILGVFAVLLGNEDDTKKKLFGDRKIPPLPSLKKFVSPEDKKLKRKLMALNLPEEVLNSVKKDFDRLTKAPRHSSDSHVLRSYLETVAALPWNTSTDDNVTLEEAEQILERDHYSMKRIKKRILEFLAVHKLGKELESSEKIKMRNPILCFVGYPGVGKTSVAQSIAHALGRKFVRIALGGTSDQSVIRGHRRTYIGAMCGRIINAVRVAGVNNPVILLDEIDKLASGARGDPAAALLEVLDPEQNSSFVDNYLNVPFDLSTCIFICTANDLSDIPHALADRLEIISMRGYTLEEKFEIAKKFLLPKQMKSHGMESWVKGGKLELIVSDEFLKKMISKYTRETGVRDIDRKLAALCRNVVLKVSKRKDEDKVVISLDSEDDLTEIFGVNRFKGQKKRAINNCGMATGMSVNAYGGKIQVLETTRVKVKEGCGEIQLTGQLGSVLQESAHIAITYLRSNAARFGLADDFDDYKYHIHMPAGSTRKDGPSAGITMATALLSLLSNKLVNSDVVMTGELSLCGRVLPIGGVKQKVMAAQRLGYTKVVLPSENKVDAENDLPKDLAETMEIIYVDFVDQVFKVAIEGFGDVTPKIGSRL